MDQMLNVLTVFSILLLALVLVSVRRARIRVEYSVSWLLASTLLLVISQWPGLLARLPGWLGVSDTALALVMLCGGIFLVVLYRLSLVISDLKDSNIALIQRIAILEYRLESSKEQSNG
ncbi:MAG: DUF2304 domain-containing protein [Bryobacteraceae bacterium]